MIEGTGENIKGILNSVLMSQKIKQLTDKLDVIVKEFNDIKKKSKKWKYSKKKKSKKKH